MESRPMHGDEDDLSGFSVVAHSQTGNNDIALASIIFHLSDSVPSPQ
jgi:hypothetical protein